MVEICHFAEPSLSVQSPVLIGSRLSEGQQQFWVSPTSLQSLRCVNLRSMFRLIQGFGQLDGSMWMSELPSPLLVTLFILWCTRLNNPWEELCPLFFAYRPLRRLKLALWFLVLSLSFCLCMEKSITALALCPVLLLYFFDLIVERVSEKPQEPCLRMFKLLMLLK